MKKLLTRQKHRIHTESIINKKTFTKMRFRLIPPQEGMTPGVENIKIFVNPMERGTSSPASWGYPCPIIDALEVFKCKATKDAKEEMYNTVRVTREWWFTGIDKEAPGTPDNPNILILPGTEGIYAQVLDQLIGEEGEDEDESNDITDVYEGQDIWISKEGAGLDTKWRTKFLPPSPISRDEDYVAAIIEAAATFDVKEHFYRVDAEVLQVAYTLVSGKKGIPKEYMEGIEACSRPGPVPSAPKSMDAPVAEFAKPKPKIVIGKTRVSFVCPMEGVVTGEWKDGNGKAVYEVIDDTGNAWTVPKTRVTVASAIIGPLT